MKDKTQFSNNKVSKTEAIRYSNSISYFMKSEQREASMMLRTSKKVSSSK